MIYLQVSWGEMLINNSFKVLLRKSREFRMSWICRFPHFLIEFCKKLLYLAYFYVIVDVNTFFPNLVCRYHCKNYWYKFDKKKGSVNENFTIQKLWCSVSRLREMFLNSIAYFLTVGNPLYISWWLYDLFRKWVRNY
jgi:hypothetical protein